MNALLVILLGLLAISLYEGQAEPVREARSLDRRGDVLQTWPTEATSHETIPSLLPDKNCLQLNETLQLLYKAKVTGDYKILFQDGRLRRVCSTQGMVKAINSEVLSQLAYQMMVNYVDSQVKGFGGAMFVRWGRTTCPAGNEIVFSGIIGGALSSKEGGGAEYVCLPRIVEYGKYTNTMEGHSTIYGAEYKVNENIFEHSNSETLNNQDAVCAVCRSQTKTSKFMVPGRKTCPGSGWNAEYWGYLMSANAVHKAQHNYICVDSAPEADPEGYRSDGGAYLYHVQAVCGSLPCPNYVNGRELTCVVCTK